MNLKGTIEEGGFSRLMRMMKADVPSVRTFGIITAWNPSGQKLSRKENEARNESLKDLLRAGNYGYVAHKGNFGAFERPFFVPNISREDLVRMGKTYDQAAVIFGSRMDDGRVKFEYINCNTGATEDTKHQVIGDVTVQNRSEFYSEIGGRKYQAGTGRKWWIPFFDPAYEGFSGETYGIHLFEVSNLPSTPEISNCLVRIANCEAALQEKGRTGNWYWHHRGLLLNACRHLEELNSSYRGMNNALHKIVTELVEGRQSEESINMDEREQGYNEIFKSRAL